MTTQTEDSSIDNCFENNPVERILAFDPMEEIAKATNYSAFSNYSRHSMVVDAMIYQLQEHKNNANKLLKYAKKHNLNGETKGKVQQIEATRNHYTTLIRSIKEDNPKYDVFSMPPRDVKNIEKKPESYKAHVKGLAY